MTIQSSDSIFYVHLLRILEYGGEGVLELPVIGRLVRSLLQLQVAVFVQLAALSHLEPVVDQHLRPVPDGVEGGSVRLVHGVFSICRSLGLDVHREVEHRVGFIIRWTCLTIFTHAAAGDTEHF